MALSQISSTVSSYIQNLCQRPDKLQTCINLETSLKQVTVDTVVTKLESLVLSHQRLSSQKPQPLQNLETLEQQIFELLGLSQPETTPSGSILIVDDTPEDLRLLSIALTQRGYEVARALSSSIALMGVQNALPDLIVLNILMPEMNGYEVCEQLKADPCTCEIPIIFISAVDAVSDKVRAFKSGGVDYITKPFQVEEVLARVEHQLKICKLQKRLAAQATNQQQELQTCQQLEARLRSQRERERLMAAIVQRVSQSLTSDDILNTTVSEVRQFLQVDRVILAQFEPGRDGIIVAEATHEDWASTLGTTIDKSWSQGLITSYPALGSQPINHGWQASLPVSMLNFINQQQIKAFLTVPILTEERLLPMLLVCQCSHVLEWQPFEVSLLRELAIQIAIAIQQSDLYERAQQLNANLKLQVRERTAQVEKLLEFEALLKRITDRVCDSLDENQILQTVVQELANGLNVCACDIATYSLKQKTSTIRYEHLCPELAPAQGVTFSMSYEPDLYAQFLRGQHSQFCKVSHAVNVVRFGKDRFAILACPIVADQEVLGDLHLFQMHGAGFGELEVRLVQQVANQCAIALRQCRLDQSARAQVEELERLNRLKNDFLNTVSHELRTPLSNIKMAIQMLEVVLKPLGILQESSAVDRYFQILKEQCQREISLINDLLDLSPSTSQVEPLELNTRVLQSWLSPLLEPFIERSHNQHQSFRVEYAANLPLLTTDFSHLWHIVVELLNNACKYTPAGETITVSVRSIAEKLQICISNSGVEIPEHERDRIFDKFYRIPKADPWQHNGIGLGLTLVRKRVEQLQGRIQVISELGLTTFIVELPSLPIPPC